MLRLQSGNRGLLCGTPVRKLGALFDRPYGAQVISSGFPALKSWAKFVRPYGPFRFWRAARAEGAHRKRVMECVENSRERYVEVEHQRGPSTRPAERDSPRDDRVEPVATKHKEFGG